jgi:putative ABC transport system permease protein
MSGRDRLPLRLSLGLVRAFSALVPRHWRREWRREWEAEFVHRQQSLDRRIHNDWRSDMDLVRKALGALPDAAWLRRQFTSDAELVHDVRHGARMLRKSPTFTAAAVVTLALGIGGTVSIATLLDTLFFRGLPYAEAERIVTLWQRPATGERDDVAPATFLDWRERSRSFEWIAAAIPYSYDFTGGGEPEVFFGALVTEGFWDVLGVQMALGRGFHPEEHVKGARPVCVISYGLWQRKFGGDPSIINRAVSLDGAPMTIIGVLPAHFKPQLLPRPAELTVWGPKVIQDHERRVRGSAWWNVVARLKTGVTTEQAQAEMTAIAAALGREYPATNGQLGVEVVPLREHLMGDLKIPLLVMLAAVALVLTIGCANVASLLLARGMQREREFAIRSALGAGRWRLVRQLIVESLLLSAVAAVAGVALAYWLVGAIVALAPPGVLRLHDAVIDGRILGFAALVTSVAALAFGVLPALQFSRPGRDAMRDRQAVAPRGAFRRTLVAVEVAIAVVLLTSAGLLLRSFERLISVDPGFSPNNTVMVQAFAWDRHGSPDRTRTFFRTTIERMQALPGVEAVGASSAMPFAFANIDIKSGLQVLGREQKAAGDQRQVYVTIATPGYLRAMAIPLREGRFLQASDGEKAPLVAVISDGLRRREWPNESPLGRRIRINWQGKPLEPEIVGVISQIRHEGLDTAPRAEVFLPLEQTPFASMTYVLRGTGDPAALIHAAKQAVWSVDPLQTFYETGRVEQMISSSVVRQRFSTTLVSAFASVALVLCAIGIYGVISFATAQRTREIGVRMALGADRQTIRRMVMREGATVIGIGLAAGLIASAGATRYLQTLLFEVRAIDPLTLVSVSALLTVIALAACYIPARRATRVDPVVALRVD